MACGLLLLGLLRQRRLLRLWGIADRKLVMGRGTAGLTCFRSIAALGSLSSRCFTCLPFSLTLATTRSAGLLRGWNRLTSILLLNLLQLLL